MAKDITKLASPRRESTPTKDAALSDATAKKAATPAKKNRIPLRKTAVPAKQTTPAVKKSNKNTVRGQLVLEEPSQKPLTRINYILMAICGALIILGFCLMGGGSTTAESFNPDIFSSRRIVVGPTISFIGFVLMAFAIMWRKPAKKTAADGHA